MKFPAFDRDLARTVLFSVAVVLVVIGIYQSILQNSVLRNYELFMLASICLLLYRYLRLPEKPDAAAEPAKPERPRKSGSKAKKRR
ncbi:hypothetical protein [Hymenobacter jeollabukensis]|uniref:Uncharacterized protein n=1 Tax=Hymenobacter jeollabukensis TaxID=2025313 RepID=A0A5R8WUN3_9BACT|nr:hypothetical protein [Hymenobacter jeollabukensis]TLM95115.1 hypothetical protein FDY95_04790 [Hymenobacter jeollabukensis]